MANRKQSSGYISPQGSETGLACGQYDILQVNQICLDVAFEHHMKC